MLCADQSIYAILGILGVEYNSADQSTHRSQATNDPPDYFLVHDFFLKDLFAFFEAACNNPFNICHLYLVKLCIILNETH